MRALAIGAGIDFGRRYKDQSITKLAKLMVAVSTCPKRVPLTNIKQAPHVVVVIHEILVPSHRPIT